MYTTANSTYTKAWHGKALLPPQSLCKSYADRDISQIIMDSFDVVFPLLSCTSIVHKHLGIVVMRLIVEIAC